MSQKEIETVLAAYEEEIKAGKKVTFQEFIKSMEREKQEPIDKKTDRFFSRQAEIVVREFADMVYEPDKPRGQYERGKSKVLIIGSQRKEKSYRVVLAEAYGEEDATRVWQRGRLERLRSLPPGGVVAFAFRASTLSFIKTKGGENILIREVEDVETGGRLKTPSEVSKLLGLSHGDEGRLVNVGRGVFKFQRLS